MIRSPAFVSPCVSVRVGSCFQMLLAFSFASCITLDGSLAMQSEHYEVGPGLSLVAAGSTALTDAASLLQFKMSILQDPMGILAGWRGDDPCVGNWTGLACNSDNRVVKLELSNAGLVGHLPTATLVSLDMLEILDLSLNSLSGNLSNFGDLPGSCKSLKLVNLSSNLLDGNITSKILACGQVEKLILSHNKFTGNLPQDLFSNCGNLQVLDLSDNLLRGSLPPGISQCHSLEQLLLSANNFTGQLPFDILPPFSCVDCVKNGTSLHTLDLSSNYLSGPISESVFRNNCSGLISLDLSSNRFSGEIPSSIESCTSLQMLNLSVNQLSNGIAKSLGNLASVERLYLSNNNFTGPIPNELGGFCSTLLELDLSINNITGTIPLSFASCTELQKLNLASNGLSGSFPIDIVANLHSLQELMLGFNSFSGSFPVGISNCSNLKFLDFSSNSFSGVLPTDMCSSSFGLEELYLPNNHLSGNIPAGLANCSSLRVLDLSFNNLNGPIPPSLTSLSNLDTLSMWFNELTGNIPPQFGALPNLRNLILNDNYLTGVIPIEITNCSRLEWLSLSSNYLISSLPRQIGNMKMLALLEVSNNSLTGDLPVELGNCTNLLWLDASNNHLTGTIPSRLGRFSSGPPEFHILSGDVFSFVRNKGNECRGMGSLIESKGIPDSALWETPLIRSCASTIVYNNKSLTGTDPDYGTIQYLDLSYNQLHGSIPAEMGYMHALEVLGLAHNQLTGSIPPTFGLMRYLGLLDLSFNHLEGSIWPLGNCTFIVQIDVSNNNFSGPIPSTGQLSIAPASSYFNNPGLCGSPLPNPCGSESVSDKNTSSGRPCVGTCIHNRSLSVFSWQKCIVLAVLASIACFCVLTVWAVFTRSRKKKRKESILLSGLHYSYNRSSSSWNLIGEREPLSINVATFERPLKKLTFSQLIEATNGFSQESLVGSGGFGEVYKAELKDGSTVAIKKLLRFSFQGDREFTAEMETLGKIKHRNLVPLLGYCKVGEERMLVYEYMPCGSLEDMLHGDKAREQLSWDFRKQIAKGAARGLAFLHHNCIPHIIHRDMKSSNVLLDRNLEARVSDFGMARLISALDTHLSVSTLAGTPGYVPPEYYQSFRCTTKGDVYSFGVVLLELVTGKPPTDPKEDFGDSNLVGWVKMHVKENRSAEVLDEELATRSLASKREMLQYLKIACECVDDIPSKRPTMLEVVAVLKELVLQEEN